MHVLFISGIQYRISKDVPKANEGRVEISVGGVWGTVCSRYWDNKDARVFCRDRGYNDGYSIRNTFGTMGSGPMWLSGLRCKGTESTLHQCPHSGFNNEPVEDGYFYGGCRSHYYDAYVFCVDQGKPVYMWSCFYMQISHVLCVVVAVYSSNAILDL